MNLIMTDIANISAYLIPVVPTGTSVKVSGANSTEDTLTGNIRVMNNSSLRCVSWESFFPVNKNYNFVPTGALKNGWIYVTFIETMRRFKLPIRIIGTTASKIPIFNFLASIDDFAWQLDKIGDINYSISLTEFPEGFFNFVNRDKQVYKYVKKYIKSNNKLSALKKAGLMAIQKVKGS